MRSARREDLAALVALERHFPSDRLSRANFRHLLARGHCDVLVYARGNAVFGNAVVLYRHGSHRARLYSLVTHPAHRGQGIGRQLLAAAERTARKRGCRRLCLEVRPDNRSAIRLYTKRGYTPLARLSKFYEDGADALRFERVLSR